MKIQYIENDIAHECDNMAFERKTTYTYSVKMLQIGHEPISPKPTVTLFGKPALKLPNVFTYSKSDFVIYCCIM